MSASTLDASSELHPAYPTAFLKLPLGASKALKPTCSQLTLISPQQTGSHPGRLSPGRALPFSQLYKSETGKSFLIPPSPYPLRPAPSPAAFTCCTFALTVLYLLHLSTSAHLCYHHGDHSGPSNDLLPRFLQVPFINAPYIDSSPPTKCWSH